MKTIMTLAAVAVCGLAVLVSGCKEETEQEKAEKALNSAAADAGKKAEAAKNAAADAAKKAGDSIKGALDGLKK